MRRLSLIIQVGSKSTGVSYKSYTEERGTDRIGGGQVTLERDWTDAAIATRSSKRQRIFPRASAGSMALLTP